MLFTRKGDDGTTGLFGTKERLKKTDPIYDALGTLDELNSFVGVCRAHAIQLEKEGELIAKELLIVQEHIFILQAQLAGAEKAINVESIESMEKTIHGIETMILGRHSFAIPGATQLSGSLDFARAIARRAERAVISQETRNIPTESQKYLNRLSSLLFALARYAALKAGVKEPSPSY